MEYVIMLIIGIGIFAILYHTSIEKKFQDLGNMTGMHKDEIIKKVGSPPNSVSQMAGGNELLQWQDRGFHIAIMFDSNGVFDGITHQYSNHSL